MPNYQPIAQLLSEPGSLQPLLNKAKHLHNLSLTLRDAVDPVLASHITLSNIRGDTAVVTTDTSAWLANIRYLAPTLLQILQQQTGLEKLRQIQFKVQPGRQSGQTPTEPRRVTLSQHGAQVLTDAACAINDPDLSGALHRLSQRARNTDESEKP